MTYEEMERALEFMKELQIKLEQFQVESEERHVQWHVNFQHSLDALLEQQAKASAGMAELRDWGKELAKSQVRVQNSVADLNELHKQLVEAQKKADDRFSSFLAALERRFGKNGHF
ncbi:MAG TPA: hypothetical protein VG206_26845 [Terriglobia bacterium]|nr:hypothetical protein [Terriglobia bacterium]